MATTTVPEVATPEVTKKPAPVTLTANAVTKVKEIMGQQTPFPPACGLESWVADAPVSPIPCSLKMALE